MTAVPPPSSSAVPCIYSPTPWSSCAPCSPLHISSLPPKQAVPWQSSWQPPVWDCSPIPTTSFPVLLISISFFCHASDVPEQITGPSAFFPPPQNHRTAPQIPPTAHLSVSSAGSCDSFCVTGTISLSVWWPAKLFTYLWSQHCSFYLLADSAIKQSPIQQLILWNNVGNLYLRPLSPICFGHNHFAVPKVLQQWKNRDNLSLISLGNQHQPTPHPFPSLKASLNELCTQESLGPFTFCAEADILIIKPPWAWCRVAATFKATEMFCSLG